MTETIVRGLDRAALDQISLRAFGTQPNALEACAREYSREVLCGTLRQLASDLSRLMHSLPERAFAAQPDDLDGNDVWSAGQVAGHLAAIEVASLPVWETILGQQLAQPEAAILEVVDLRLPDSRQAIAVAEALERSVQSLATAVLVQPDQGRIATHFALGTVGVGGALLGLCIHLADHVGQLEELQRDGADG
jgi:hypothetical protein